MLVEHPQVLTCDAREGAKLLKERSVHCMVCSPPYYKKRDYDKKSKEKWAEVQWADGSKCDLGWEPEPEQFADHLVEVFNAQKRILRPEATLWVNLADTHANKKYANGRRLGDDI